MCIGYMLQLCYRKLTFSRYLCSSISKLVLSNHNVYGIVVIKELLFANFLVVRNFKENN